MKRVIALLTVVGMAACAAELSREAQEVLRNGAKAKMTFLVTDSRGKPVTNANVNVVFVFLGSLTKEVASLVTDTNGICVVEGVCSSRINCQFTKDGHYQTDFEHKYLTTYPEPNVKDGKWQPWNPTIEITLKEKRNPIPMYIKKVRDDKLPKNEWIEFDCEKGDWVTPHGKGQTGDFSFHFKTSVMDWRRDQANRTNQLIIASKEDGGFIELQKESGAFRSLYEAPETGYVPRIVLSHERENGKVTKEVIIPQDRYLVFRSRVEKNEKGEIIHSRFGKIMSFTYGEGGNNGELGYVEFTYYFNPNDNDRNIEFATGQNLFGRREFNSEP